MSESTDQHREAAAGQSARCALMTISDTRTKDTDKSGKIISKALKEAGHKLKEYAVVPDEPDLISTHLRNWLRNPLSTIHEAKSDFDVIFTNGGTGIAKRDTTVEVVRKQLDKELEGFGELFRMLSYEQVGPAAMLSRAVAGLSGQCLIFAMPGSPDAVQLAMDKLIIPELPHLIWERKR